MDPYEILGVSPDASKEEIKAAYRKLARLYHPDANPDDKAAAEKMNLINQAYEAIQNAQAQPDPFEWGNEFYSSAGYGSYGFYTGSGPYTGSRNRGASSQSRTPDEYYAPKGFFLTHPRIRQALLLLVAAAMILMSIAGTFFQAAGR